MKRRMGIAFALVAALGLAAMPATAGKATKSKLKIAAVSASGATGKLKSKSPKCVKKRKVTVQFSGEYSPVRVGTDKTDSRGRWATTKPISERGVFYATAKPVKRGKVKCAAAKSKNFRFS